MSTLRTPPDRLDPNSTPSPPSSAEHPAILIEREVLRDVTRLVAERARAEAEVERTRRSNDELTDRDYHERKKALGDRFEGTRAVELHEDAERRRAITDASIAGEASAKDEFAKASRKIASEFDAAREQARSDHAKSRARATADFEMGEKQAAAAYAEARKPIDHARQLIESRKARLAVLYYEYKHFGLPEAPTLVTATRGSHKAEGPLDKVFDRLQKIEPNLALLEGLIIPKSMKGKGFVWIFVVLTLLLVLPLVLALGVQVGLPVAVGLVVVGGYLLKVQLFKLSRDQVGKFYYPLSQSLIDSEALVREAKASADDQLKADRLRVASTRDEAHAKAKAKQTKAIADGEADRDERLRVINEVYARRKVETQTRLAREMREAVDRHDKRMTEIPVQEEAATRKLVEKYDEAKEKIRAHHESAWNSLATRWHQGMAEARGRLDGVAREVDAYAPRWDDPSWPDRSSPQSVPPLLRIGETRVHLDQLPGGASTDPRLAEGINPRFDFPALLPFPDHANIVVEAPLAGRPASLGVLQGAMYRLLTSLPPGQVRFTIIDPIGIGRNFGAFMHLADFDESLVGGQVLTEARQIDERLAELALHMEKVTQKYLRNEYATIDEYNAVAGEVAEPYRVLVVADFPVGFDERSAARLQAITSGGTPCGVITLVVRDLDRPLPMGFDAEALRVNATPLTWQGSSLTWPDPDFAPHPLTLDVPPSGELATRLIQKLGAAARGAKRVEVPFEFIAPGPDDWWKLDSRTGIDLPLGKSGRPNAST